MNRYGSEWHSLFRCRSRQAERYSGTGGGPCRTESMPMVIRQVAVGRYRPLFFRRSRACLSGMYFHAVSVVPYVPSRAAGGWRSGRTGRNGGDAARGGRRILSSFESVFRWSEKDACCPVSVPGIARAEAFAGSRRKRGRIVPSPFASVFRPPGCAPADLFVSHEVVGGVLILHERTLRLE